MGQQQVHRHLAGGLSPVTAAVGHLDEMLPLLFAHVLPYLDLVIEYWIILVTAVGPVPLYDKIAAFFFNYQIRHQIRRSVLLGGRLLTDEPVGERADT